MSHYRIFFISSQFISDRDRSKMEDELTKKYNVDVRILDRSWIIEKVIDNKRTKLAIDTLKIDGLARNTVVKGPRDAEREAELETLEEQIKDQDRYRGVGYQLFEDCLRAAILSKELERPRIKTEGRFDRAANVAVSEKHKLECAYQRCWATYWWFNDYAKFNSLYDGVEALTLVSQDASDFQKLTNLWTLLNTSVRSERLEPFATKLEARTKS